MEENKQQNSSEPSDETIEHAVIPDTVIQPSDQQAEVTEEPNVAEPSNLVDQSTPTRDTNQFLEQTVGLTVNLPSEEIPDIGNISWNATEFIQHKKSMGWFLSLSLILIVISGLVFIVVHSIFPIVMILLLGIAFGVIAGRSPKIVSYEISNSGVKINSNINVYNQFKSFSVVNEGNIGSIVFNPFKRFSFSMSIYYDPSDEERIISALDNYLPRTEASNDPIDQLMRRFHF